MILINEEAISIKAPNSLQCNSAVSNKLSVHYVIGPENKCTFHEEEM